MSPQRKKIVSAPAVRKVNAPGAFADLKPKRGEKQLFEDLKKYRQMALDLGAEDAVIMPASEFTMDLRVWWKCQLPRCGGSGTNPNCPPLWKVPWEEAKRLKNSYKYCLVFRTARDPKLWTGTRMRTREYNAAHSRYMPKERAEKAQQELKEWVDWLDNYRKAPVGERTVGVAAIAPRIRDQARRDGHHFAITFAAGSCMAALCVRHGATCVAMTTGLCRYPGRACPEGAPAIYADFVGVYRKLGWKTRAVGFCAPPEMAPPEPAYFGISMVFIE